MEALTIEPAGEMTAEGPPDVLTVPEAGQILRLGRSAAYEQANRWIETDGADGMPAKRIGRALRVPRGMLEDFIGGPISWPPPATVLTMNARSDSTDVLDANRIASADAYDRQGPRKRRTAAAKQAESTSKPSDAQSQLPFTA